MTIVYQHVCIYVSPIKPATRALWYVLFCFDVFLFYLVSIGS